LRFKKITVQMRKLRKLF